MTPIINIAAYKFVALDNLEDRRIAVMTQAQAEELKGTVLLTPEGINLFLAGTQEHIDRFLEWLRQEPAFHDLEAKFSVSDDPPFKRLLVKIKREIIRMNHPTIRPEAGRAPSVDAQTAARWITRGQDDDGRPVVLLDTRNDFEVDAGTFEGAINWHITKFTEFPQAVLDHKDELAGKTVISFCTGVFAVKKRRFSWVRPASSMSISSMAGFSSISKKPVGSVIGVIALYSTSAGHWIRRLSRSLFKTQPL